MAASILLTFVNRMMPTGFQEYCKNAPWNRAVGLGENGKHTVDSGTLSTGSHAIIHGALLPFGTSPIAARSMIPGGVQLRRVDSGRAVGRRVKG
jgi:hypothetical protein